MRQDTYDRLRAASDAYEAATGRQGYCYAYNPQNIPSDLRVVLGDRSFTGTRAIGKAIDWLNSETLAARAEVSDGS